MTERKLNQAVLNIEQGKELSEDLDGVDKEDVRKRLIERLKNNKQMRVKFISEIKGYGEQDFRASDLMVLRDEG